MPEVKLGSKHECPSCSAKFYDLGKPKPVCPSCGAEMTDEGDGSAESKKPPRSREEE